MNRDRSLDSLRGLAALSVFACHSIGLWPEVFDRGPSWLYLPPIHALWSGRAAVILFFVLSGYVLSLPFWKGTAPGPLGFALKRLARLYPLYLLAIVASALWAIPLGGHVLGGSRLADPLTVLQDYWSMLLPIGSNLISTPTWSLIFELRASLVFPLLVAALCLPRAGFLVAVLGVVGLTVGTIQLHASPVIGGLAETELYLPMFMAGALLARHREQLVEWYRGLRWRWLVPATSVMLYGNALPFIHGPWDEAVALGSCGLLVTVLAEPRLEAALRWRPLVEVGEASFSLYVLHPLVLWPAALLLGVSLPVVLACWPVVIGMALLSQRAVERPSIALSRWLGRNELGPDVFHLNPGWLGRAGNQGHGSRAAVVARSQLPGVAGIAGGADRAELERVVL